MAFYGDGLFEFVSDSSREYFKNAHWAITETNMWEWLATFTPPNNEGFSYCEHPYLKMIETKMFEQEIAQGHSGSSYGITLRNMKYIAEHGYDAFRTLWYNQQSQNAVMSG